MTNFRAPFKKEQIIQSAVPEPYLALTALGFSDHPYPGLEASFGTPGWYMAPFQGWIIFPMK